MTSRDSRNANSELPRNNRFSFLAGISRMTNKDSIFLPNVFTLCSICILVFLFLPFRVLCRLQESILNSTSFFFFWYENTAVLGLNIAIHLAFYSLMVLLFFAFPNNSVITATSNSFITGLTICMMFNVKDTMLVVVSFFICFIVIFVLAKVTKPLVFILTRAVLTSYLLLNIFEFYGYAIFTPLLVTDNADTQKLQANLIFLAVLILSVIASFLMNFEVA